MCKLLFVLIVVFLSVFLLLACGPIKNRSIDIPTATEIAWAKSYGGAKEDFARSIQQTRDGGYVVAGDTHSFGRGDSDFWLLKLNSDGTIAWQKRYGGANDDWAMSIQQTRFLASQTGE
jgi:hypothetical protein